jgi:hypothetical protein
MAKYLTWGLAAALLVAAGLFWLQSRESLLSAEPERRAGRLVLPPRESDLALRLRLPVALLRGAADRAMPDRFHQASEEGADPVYDLTIRRDSFSLAPAGGKLRAAVALTVEGTAGLGGGLAALLALDENNIDAAAEVQADLSLALGEDWCPSVGMETAYRWTRSPRLEVLGGVWVNIEERVRAQAEAALRALPAQLNALIPCDRIRAEAQALWQPRAIKVQLPAAPPLHVSIRPQSVGLSELAVQGDALQVVLGLRAQTAVGSDPPRPGATAALPPLRALSAAQAQRDGRLRLSIPVRAGYDMIRDWLMREFGGRDIPVETPLGTVALRVREIFLYPSAPAIALAVGFDADMPGAWPDTSGRVIFSAQPVLSQGGTRIGLTELRFSRSLDSAAWSIATILFERQIRARLSEIAVYDLKEVMDGAMAELRRRLSDPAQTGGLRVTLTRPALRLEQVVAENDALSVLGTAEAGVEAEVTALPVP